MSCLETIQSYAMRSLGIGERLLPRSDFTLCEQFTLIGSGMIWNIYFGLMALCVGFFFRNSPSCCQEYNKPLGSKAS